jgi:pentatricopeptide repeat protein
MHSYQTHLPRPLHLLQLFLWMQENNKLDVYSYSHYIKFMANKLDASTMLKLYNNIQDESAKDNVYVCNSVLRCLIKKGKFDTAIKLFQQMKQDGLVPDLVTYSTVCNSFVHCFCVFL